MSKLYLGDKLVWGNPENLGHVFIKLRKQIREDEIIERMFQRVAYRRTPPDDIQ